MRNFRLAGTCIFLSLIVGCAGTATEGMRENNKITKEGFARLKMDAASSKTKPQYQCPPPGLPSPDHCFYYLNVTLESGQVYGQVADEVIVGNKKDCEKWNSEHPELPPMKCADLGTYRKFKFPLPIDGEPGVGQDAWFQNDTQTGKLKKLPKDFKPERY